MVPAIRRELSSKDKRVRTQGPLRERGKGEAEAAPPVRDPPQGRQKHRQDSECALNEPTHSPRHTDEVLGARSRGQGRHQADGPAAGTLRPAEEESFASSGKGPSEQSLWPLDDEGGPRTHIEEIRRHLHARPCPGDTDLLRLLAAAAEASAP